MVATLRRVRSCTLAAAVLAAVVHRANGQANSPWLFDHKKQPQEVQVLCVIDVLQTVVSLGQAGDAIYRAVTTCQDVDSSSSSDKQAICSLWINQLMLSFSFAASWLAGAAADCAATVNVPAFCASDVANLVADLNTLGWAGSGMVESCAKVNGKNELKRHEILEAMNEGRRKLDLLEGATPNADPRHLRNLTMGKDPVMDQLYLEFQESQDNLVKKARGLSASVGSAETREVLRSAIDKLPPRKLLEEMLFGNRSVADLEAESASTKPDDRKLQSSFAYGNPLQVLQAKLIGMQNLRKSDIAECTFNAASTVLWLIRASMGVNQAVKDCLISGMVENSMPSLPDRGQMLCAVDITGLVGSFAWAVSVLSYAIAQCPDTVSSSFKPGQGIVPGSSSGGGYGNQDLNALCAGDVAGVVAGLAGIATSGASFQTTCGAIMRKSMGIHRRLADEDAMVV